ncbi:long-chain fatty acid--CoA ligase [Metallumcola ferriviriculae]|uniref:Long-chain fatty acid--CoA ligase n=1 Tax=Metallumcola ferriviriculae TaxID=3039180 RepID=A0AAU0URJ4_9FIRM|nr:long-chain fatty acid--CoA ligase [Desulfitibacteraceae bacterium MK1]
MNFISSWERVAEKTPNKNALEFEGRKISYREFLNMARTVGRRLEGFGVTKGDRVVLMLDNTPEFVIAYFGIILAQAVIVPVNPRYRQREVQVIIEDCQPKVLITTADNVTMIEAIQQQVNSIENIFITDSANIEGILNWEQLLKPVLGSGQNQVKDDDVIEFLYTSGTTGIPKGAMLSHTNLYSNAVEFARILEFSADERSLVLAPIYHSAAQTCVMNATLVSGGTLVLKDRWISAEDTLQAFQDKKITFFFGPPTMYAFILNHPELPKYDVSALRVAFTGAASLPEGVFNRFKEVFGFEIVEGYGLSEASPVVATNPFRGAKKLGSVGQAFPGVDIKIVDSDDNEVPTGTVGEITCHGPNVMQGYYQKPDETKQSLKDGWLHTGDMGYVDEDGYYYIVDRKKDMIIRGGLNIYPREVEEVLYSHPKVLEAAVIGVPHSDMGEVPKAVIVLKDSIKSSADDIRGYCREQLSSYKVPQFFEFVTELPKTSTGKILKRELRKQGKSSNSHSNSV